MQRVFLAVSDEEERMRIRNLITNQETMRIAGETENGEEVLDKVLLLEPDVIIMNIILPGMDGLEVLRQLQKVRVSTNIIMVSYIRDPRYVMKAINLGAAYYMIKPYRTEALLDNIKQLDDETVSDRNGLDVRITGKPEKDVAVILNRIGVPQSTKGWVYLRDAIQIFMSDPNYKINDLYDELAEKYRTTPAAIDRAMRHAVERTLQVGQRDKMESALSIPADIDKVPVKEFVRRIATMYKMSNVGDRL